MKAGTMRKTWKQLFLVFAFLSTEAHGQEKPSCSSSEYSFEKLHKQLKNIKDCLEVNSIQWTTFQNADFFNQLRTLTDIIQTQQNIGKTTITITPGKYELLKLVPANCSVPAVPSDGGLMCVSAEYKIYCKPMCNAGYDFHLMRRSRLYEECSAATQYKWTTQYIGGNRLADCTKSQISVAGAQSAFFPEDMACHKIKSDEQLMGNITNIFHSELIKAGVTSLKSSALLCGQNKN